MSNPLYGAPGAGEDQAGPRELAAVPKAAVMVVLGGGVSGPRPPRRPDPGLNAAADRYWQGAWLFHAGEAKRLYLTGGEVRGVTAPSRRPCVACSTWECQARSCAWRRITSIRRGTPRR